MSRLSASFRCLLLCGAVFAPMMSAHADRVPSRPPPPAAEVGVPAAEAPKVPEAAAPSAPAAKAAPDAEGFVPDSRPANMTTVDVSVPAGPLVATAYGFIWLAVLGFVLFTLQRTRRLEQEIAELSARIAKPAPRA